MKKGYHDYVPLIKDVKQEKEVEVKKTHEPKYVTTPSGIRHMISDERGMVVATTEILMFGSKLPAAYTSRPANVKYRMNTKDYIKYNGRL